MGHRDWRATRIYAHLTYDKVSEDMGKLQERIGGKFALADSKPTTTTRVSVELNKTAMP